MKSGFIKIVSIFLFFNLSITNYSNARIFFCPQINSNDSVVFDLSSAVMTGNIIDIPVYFSSTDSILSLDFSLKYNEQKIAFDSLINYTSYIAPLASFNANDRYLRFTSISGTFIPYRRNTALFALRFHFVNANSCQQINSSDLNSISTYLNGDPCSYKITTSPPFRVPVANFTNNRSCLGKSVTFNDASRLLQGNIVSWAWNFGNGVTSTLRNPTTTFTNLSTYNVSLIVRSNTGCLDTIIKQIRTNATPSANFTQTVSCQTGNTMFTDNSSISSGTITAWYWDFGDHNQSNIRNPIHNFYTNGAHTVSLTATSDSGCTSTYSRAITVSVLQAQFTVANTCINKTVSFTDNSTSSANSGPITQWKWYLGDGTISNSQNTSNIYYISGNYTVSLKISNSNCSDSISQTITIDNSPIVMFGVDNTSGCLPLTVSLSDSSITTTGSNYLWNFGDNSNSALQHPTHTYTANGNYNVTLIVTTPGGCSDTSTQNSVIDVYGAAVSFSVSPQKIKLPDAKVKFTNLTSVYTQWNWNFGDDSTVFSTEKSPQHNYESAGIYKVCLTASSSDGCSNFYCDSITVLNPNVVGIPQAFTPNGDNLNDSLFVRGGPVKEMEFRIFNEWGNLLFYSDEQSKGWDGTYKGTPQKAGAYEYSMKGKTDEDEFIHLHGIINLVR